MPLRVEIPLVCLFLTQVAAFTGVHFQMDRLPDHQFCGHLHCHADVSQTKTDILSFVEMSIYDITRVHTELKLASVSTFHPYLYVDTTTSSTMTCTGVISRHQSNMTVQLRHDIDCLYGVYKCQLDYVTVSGDAEVLTEIVTPEHNHSYSRIADSVSYLPRLTQQLINHANRVSKQTAQIDSLSNQFNNHTVQIDSLSNQLDNHTAKIDSLSNQLDNQTAQIDSLSNQLDNHTTQIDSLSNQWDNHTVQIDSLSNQLDNHTAQIDSLSNQLDNQTAHIDSLCNHLDNQTGKLIDHIAQLNNIYARLDAQNKEHEAQLQQVDDKLEKLFNSTEVTRRNQELKGEYGQPGVRGLARIPGQLDPIVAFTAGCDGNRDLKDGETLVLNKVILNQGGGYDKNTGIFTAPQGGIYQFQMHGLAPSDNSFWIKLYHNNMYVISAFAGVNSHDSSGGNSAFLLVRRNDKIYLKVVEQAHFYGRPDDIYVTFSGHRIGTGGGEDE